jgi:NAD(P)-dependent dehydrogenase (short-subunit alcohol dehydrogenase family)
VAAVPRRPTGMNGRIFDSRTSFGTADEIARCVVFLAADDAGFITGACLDANGGQYIAS